MTTVDIMVSSAKTFYKFVYNMAAKMAANMAGNGKIDDLVSKFDRQ